MTVKPCPSCLELVQVATDPEGRQLRLATQESRTGIWMLEPDGRTVRKITGHEAHLGRRGHPRHECSAPAAQATLFEAS